MTAGNKKQTIRLHDADNIIVALGELAPGTSIPEENIICRHLIPAGHKVATATIHPGQPVIKYHQIIGFAGQEIHPGDHVHLQNLTYRDFERDPAIGVDTRTPDFLPE